VRRYEKDFLVKPDAYREKFQAAMAKYEAMVKSADFAAPAEVKKGLAEAFAKYQGAAAILLANQETDREATIGIMKGAAHESEAAVNSVNVPGTVSMILEIRKEEKDYLLRLDDKYVQKHKAAAAKLREAFAKAGVAQEHVDEVSASLDAYEKAFASVVVRPVCNHRQTDRRDAGDRGQGQADDRGHCR